MGKKYKAAIYQGLKSIEIVEKELPDEVGEDDVIVKNLMSAICGSDMSAYNNGNGDELMIYKGLEFGHEMVSEVVAKGKNVTGVEVGDWIWPNQGYAFHDHNRMSSVGGFSEYLVLPQFSMEGVFMGRQQPSAIKLDKSVGIENLVLLEPFAVGTSAAFSMKPEGKSGIVVGAGAIGLAAAVMSKYYGADKVMVCDLSEFRLSIARKFGLLTCNPATEDVGQVLMDTFGTKYGYGGAKCGADFYFDCVGNQPAIDYFNTYAAPTSTLSIVGVHKKPASFDAVSICYNQLNIMGCGFYPRDRAFADIMDCCRKVAPISNAITHTFAYDHLLDAFEMSTRYDEALKVVVDYR